MSLRSDCEGEGYYDPNTAQFLTPDPLVAITGERYGYADNDPLNYDDPLGLMCFSWKCAKGDLHAAAHTINNDVAKPVERTDVKKDLAVAGVVAGVAALTISTAGLGDVLVAGVALDTVGTGLTAFAAGSSIAVAYGDCRSNPGTARCAADVAAAAFSTVGGGLSIAGAGLAASASELAELGGPMGMFGDGMFGVSSIGWGIGGLLMPGEGAVCSGAKG